MRDKCRLQGKNAISQIFCFLEANGFKIRCIIDQSNVSKIVCIFDFGPERVSFHSLQSFISEICITLCAGLG